MERDGPLDDSATTPTTGPTYRRRIYLVRHGDVTYFDAHGRPVPPGTVPLNEEGRRQAAAVGHELTAVALDRVMSSDLGRCVETAALITAERGLRIETAPQLREIQPGRLADLPTASLEQAFLGAFAGVEREGRFLGGETYGALADRVLACFATILANRTWNRLLLVAHGGVNRVLLAHAFGAGLGGFARLEQDPACVNVIDVADGGALLVRLVNYTTYNPLKHGLELTTMERLYRQYRHTDSGEAPAACKR